MKKKYDLVDLLESRIGEIEKQRNLPEHTINNAKAIIKCRTHHYGGHLYSCPDDHYSVVLFNSCKKRNCPVCQNQEVEFWEYKQKEKLLKTGYYHLVFKIPQIPKQLFIHNYSFFARIMFDTVRDTLKKAIGKEVMAGIIAMLHTHGRQNQFHPHIHCAVTDVGLDTDMKLQRISRDTISDERFHKLYKETFMKKLRKEIKKLTDFTKEEQSDIISFMESRGFGVFCSESYENGEGLIRYFAKSIRGAAIKNYQILNVDEEKGVVEYYYIDGNKNKVYTKMTIDIFLQRFLEHIAPDNFKTIRYYGLYSSGSSKKYEIARMLLNGDVYSKPEKGDMPREERQELVCPKCGKRLILSESFKRNEIPVYLAKRFDYDREKMRKYYLEVKDTRRGIKFHWYNLLSSEQARPSDTVFPAKHIA